MLEMTKTKLSYYYHNVTDIMLSCQSLALACVDILEHQVASIDGNLVIYL